MKNFFFILSLLGLVGLVACDKDIDQAGCTDPIAVNYEPRALKEDGTCAYNMASQLIWNDGKYGGWNGDFYEGAYRLETCFGITTEILEVQDSIPVDTLTSDSLAVDSLLLEMPEPLVSLYLGTGEQTSHRSYFTLINQRNATDYAEGSLRFDCRIPEGDTPQFMRIFIGGKLPQQGDCTPFRRSDYVEISTHAFNDSSFTEVEIPIRNFDKITMAQVDVVCGFEFDGDAETGIELNNIRWTANKD